MSGFVGSRARKKRRNVFLSLGIIILIIIVFLIFPTFENNNRDFIPNDNIIPDPSEDLTSLSSNIEELELNLFQKDQKIKFRDGQIKNLQMELKESKSKYDIVVLELSEIQNDLDTLSSNNENLVSSSKFKSLQEKFTELNIENEKKISKIKSLNKQIDELNTNLQSVNDKTDQIINENKKLKKNNKSFFAKNIKLDSNIVELKQKIIEQQIEIDSYLEEIDKLKDKSHHGG